MSGKYLIVATIVGGIVIFLWGAVTHALLPAPMRFFTHEDAVVQAVRANTVGNGVYFAKSGILASVAFLPDFGDKTLNITPNLVRQFLSDTLAALLLAIFFTRVPGSVISKATWAGLAGLIAFLLKIVPYWNWYGFSSSFMGMEALDLIGKFILGGLLLGALAKKFALYPA
jgi:hypothetical protein